MEEPGNCVGTWLQGEPNTAPLEEPLKSLCSWMEEAGGVLCLEWCSPGAELYLCVVGSSFSLSGRMREST